MPPMPKCVILQVGGRGKLRRVGRSGGGGGTSEEGPEQDVDVRETSGHSFKFLLVYSLIHFLIQ